MCFQQSIQIKQIYAFCTFTISIIKPVMTIFVSQKVKPWLFSEQPSKTLSHKIPDFIFQLPNVKSQQSLCEYAGSRLSEIWLEWLIALSETWKD